MTINLSGLFEFSKMSDREREVYFQGVAAGRSECFEKLKHLERKSYEVGFDHGYKAAMTPAIKAMEEYEATILRPIIITAPKEDL